MKRRFARNGFFALPQSTRTMAVSGRSVHFARKNNSHKKSVFHRNVYAVRCIDTQYISVTRITSNLSSFFFYVAHTLVNQSIVRCKSKKKKTKMRKKLVEATDGQTMRHKWHVNVNEYEKMHAFNLVTLTIYRCWTVGGGARFCIFHAQNEKRSLKTVPTSTLPLCSFHFIFGDCLERVCLRASQSGHTLHPIKQITGLFVHRRWECDFVGMRQTEFVCFVVVVFFANQNEKKRRDWARVRASAYKDFV